MSLARSAEQAPGGGRQKSNSPGGNAWDEEGILNPSIHHTQVRFLGLEFRTVGVWLLVPIYADVGVFLEQCLDMGGAIFKAVVLRISKCVAYSSLCAV